jgi:hypothetical protein
MDYCKLNVVWRRARDWFSRSLPQTQTLNLRESNPAQPFGSNLVLIIKILGANCF